MNSATARPLHTPFLKGPGRRGALTQFFQRPGQLVRAAGAATFAVDAFQQADDLLDLPAFAEPGQALGVAGAALDDFYAADGVAFGLKVDLRGAGDAAGGERCAAQRKCSVSLRLSCAR